MRSSVKIRLHPLALGILGIGFLTGYFKYILAIYMVVLIHEGGHIVIAKLFKRRVVSVSLLPFGGLTVLDGKISEEIPEDLLIAAGGILAQLVFGVVIYHLYEAGTLSDGIYNFFRTYNIFIIGFNLLPICPLDGYKMVKSLCELFIPYKIAYMFVIVASIIILGSLLVSKWELCKSNMFVLAFLLFMSFEEIKNRRYAWIKFYLERMHYDFYYARCDVRSMTGMFKNRINYINREHEKAYLRRYFTSKGD